MDIDKFLQLPETLTNNELRALFIELLNHPLSSEEDAIKVARGLFEISDRQWHNYQPIPGDLAESVATWVVSNWNSRSGELVANLLGIIAMLGLSSAVRVVENSLNDELDPEMRTTLTNFLVNAKQTALDPYFRMHREKKE